MRACFAIALDTQMKHGGVKAKVFSLTILWKWKLMLKVSYGTYLEIWGPIFEKSYDEFTIVKSS